MTKYRNRINICILSTILIFLAISCENCGKQYSAQSANKGFDIINPAKGAIVVYDDTTFVPSRFNEPFEKFVGVNGFHEDDIASLKAGGVLRAYCNWDWFQGDSPADEFIFQFSRGGWYFDDAFRNIKQAGITTAMCFQGAIKNLHGNGNFKFNDKPTDAPGLSTTKPGSYDHIADALFQIAARYGKTKVDPSKLKVKADQKVSGLDLVEYLEVWNEPDKGWEGADAEFSPEEYAAMLSRCYDRIKEADPKMKVVMAGLSTLSVDYLKRMKAWFEANRADKKFAADVVNMHIYAFNNNINWKHAVEKPAETPEDAGMREKATEVVKYCEANIPGARVWISEFGWDTNAESLLAPKKIGNLSLSEVQARWIIRAFLAFAAARVDNAQVFALIDPSQNYISTWFGTSGLIDRTLDFKKKESWYYVSAMKDALTGTAFSGEKKSGNADVLIYKFKSLNSDSGVYAIWSKTSEDKIITDFKLTLSPQANTAEKIEMLNNESSGRKERLTIINNSVTITVSEKPVFIKVNHI